MALVTYIGGLALGQAREFTAFAVVERPLEKPTGLNPRPVPGYAVRHLERFPPIVWCSTPPRPHNDRFRLPWTY